MTFQNQESTLARHVICANTSKNNSAKISKAGPAELSLSNETLAWIQTLEITDDSTSTYHQIGLEASHREFCFPPTTHLVATIDDLIDVLDFSSDDAEDLYADVDTADPLVTGRWTATST